MQSIWIEPGEISIPSSFIDSIGGNQLIGSVLYRRGMTDPDIAKAFLYPEYYHPTPGSQLPGVEEITGFLFESIRRGKKIGVWGDFDVDGQTATTVFVAALMEMGGNVIYHIPIRKSESHGINSKALTQFLDQDIDVLLTCDTGISAHESIRYTQQRGVPVLVTDHHDLPSELPDAQIIVNPKMLPANHALSTLPGVGVAYKIIEHLCHKIGDEKKSDQYLDLVALGIVADIALLKDETRYLLQCGLKALRNTKRLGLHSIMELSGLNQANLTEEHISFFLAPRMNALGRLHDANQIVEMLTTADAGRANILALEMEGMNAQRKFLCDQVYQAAQAQISLDPKLLDDPILILTNPNWPAGIIGIVASRLVEQYLRPVLLLSSPPGDDARGSARSIESLNITSAIAANHHLVKDFGGHPMAAGLTIDRDLIPEFHHAMIRTIQGMGISLLQEKKLQIDGYLTFPELSLELIEDLERMAPFGAGNPPIVFASRNLKLIGYVAVGRDDEHLQATIEDESGTIMRTIWWHGAGNSLPEGPFDLAYSVRASNFRGQRDVQVEWVDYRLIETPTIKLVSKKSSIEVIDMRRELEPVRKLNQIQANETAVIWGEVDPFSRTDCLDRLSLHPSKVLAIWTIPPGYSELQAAIRFVRPERVYLFGINPRMDDPENFLKRLLGLLKYRVKSTGGIALLSSLAAATAQKISTIKIGLAWLEDRGHINSKIITDDEIYVQTGDKTAKKGFQTSASQLITALSESAAFRRYYINADKDRLIIND